jgi:hypothetical protein
MKSAGISKRIGEDNHQLVWMLPNEKGDDLAWRIELEKYPVDKTDIKPGVGALYWVPATCYFLKKQRE